MNAVNEIVNLIYAILWNCIRKKTYMVLYVSNYMVWYGGGKEEVNALETTEERDSPVPGARPWVGGGAPVAQATVVSLILFAVCVLSNFAF